MTKEYQKKVWIYTQPHIIRKGGSMSELTNLNW